MNMDEFLNWLVGEVNFWDQEILAIEDERLTDFELIPIGIYNGVDLEDCRILDDNYIVYQELPNPELNCEVVN